MFVGLQRSEVTAKTGASFYPQLAPSVSSASEQCEKDAVQTLSGISSA